MKRGPQDLPHQSRPCGTSHRSDDTPSWPHPVPCSARDCAFLSLIDPYPVPRDCQDLPAPAPPGWPSDHLGPAQHPGQGTGRGDHVSPCYPEAAARAALCPGAPSVPPLQPQSLPCTPSPSLYSQALPCAPHPAPAPADLPPAPAPPPLRVARSLTRGLPNLSPLGAGAVPPLPGACPGGSAGRRLRRARDGAGAPPRDGALCRPELAPATTPPHGTGRGQRARERAGSERGGAMAGESRRARRRRGYGACPIDVGRGNWAGGGAGVRGPARAPEAPARSAGPPGGAVPAALPGREHVRSGTDCGCLLHVRGARLERCSGVAALQRPGGPGPTG